MKMIIALQTLALFPVLFSSISQASIGGLSSQYNRGSYTCVDRRGELEGQFTFGAEQANLDIKGQPVTLDCVSAQNAEPEQIAVFRDQYIRPVDICTGKSAKGNVIVATSNSAGSVQMTAVLFSPGGQRLAAASLNCEQATTSNDSKW